MLEHVVVGKRRTVVARAAQAAVRFTYRNDTAASARSPDQGLALAQQAYILALAEYRPAQILRK